MDFCHVLRVPHSASSFFASKSPTLVERARGTVYVQGLLNSTKLAIRKSRVRIQASRVRIQASDQLISQLNRSLCGAGWLGAYEGDYASHIAV